MKPKTAMAMLLFAATLLGISAFSPWILSSVDFGDTDWVRLGNVGQAYGAASSILSALALAGVSVSIVLQARQNDATRVQSEKEMRVMLTKLAMDDPAISDAWWIGVQSDSERERKQMLFADLILLQWQMAWQVGELPEPSLREHAMEVFRGVAVWRKFWSQARLHRTAVKHSASDDRFSQIIDETYLAATAELTQNADGTPPSFGQLYGTATADKEPPSSSVNTEIGPTE